MTMTMTICLFDHNQYTYKLGCGCHDTDKPFFSAEDRVGHKKGTQWDWKMLKRGVN